MRRVEGRGRSPYIHGFFFLFFFPFRCLEDFSCPPSICPASKYQVPPPPSPPKNLRNSPCWHGEGFLQSSETVFVSIVSLNMQNARIQCGPRGPSLWPCRIHRVYTGRSLRHHLSLVSAANQRTVVPEKPEIGRIRLRMCALLSRKLTIDTLQVRGARKRKEREKEKKGTSLKPQGQVDQVTGCGHFSSTHPFSYTCTDSCHSGEMIGDQVSSGRWS